MRFFKFIILAVFGLYIAVCAVAYTAQRSLLYFPPSDYLLPTDVNLPQMSEIQMQLGDTSSATSWWHPPASDANPVVMVFHGNGSAVYSNYDIFRDLIASGYGVLSVGYAGYPHKDMAVTGNGYLS